MACLPAGSQTPIVPSCRMCSLSSAAWCQHSRSLRPSGRRSPLSRSASMLTNWPLSLSMKPHGDDCPLGKSNRRHLYGLVRADCQRINACRREAGRAAAERKTDRPGDSDRKEYLPWESVVACGCGRLPPPPRGEPRPLRNARVLHGDEDIGDRLTRLAVEHLSLEDRIPCGVLPPPGLSSLCQTRRSSNRDG